jgi:hypothetical protein
MLQAQHLQTSLVSTRPVTRQLVLPMAPTLTLRLRALVRALVVQQVKAAQLVKAVLQVAQQVKAARPAWAVKAVQLS